jgi:hypothetical protein
MRRIILLLPALILASNFYSCGAARIPGEIIRGDSKKFDVVMSAGITAQEVSQLTNIGLSVNGIDASGKTLVGIGGETNSNVFSDMFMMQFMKAGYSASALTEPANELIKPEKLDSLKNDGISMVLICNNNLAATTSELDWLTGGEFAKAGVNSFTFKGYRTEDKKMLFIGTGEYEKTRTASEVSKDFVNVFTKIVQDKLKDLNKQK